MILRTDQVSAMRNELAIILLPAKAAMEPR
jgi:hypothetical protein